MLDAVTGAGQIREALASFERARDAAVRWGTPQQLEWADDAVAEARASLNDPQDAGR